MIAMAVIMIIIVSLFAKILGNKEVDAQLKSEVQQNKRYVRYIDNKYQFSHRYNRSEEEKVHLVIIDEKGKAIDGSYPEGFPKKNSKVLNYILQKLHIYIYIHTHKHM